MKNFFIFLGIICLYLIITGITTNLLEIESKIFDYLSKDYPSQVVQDYMVSQKKWWWVSYAVTPLLIGIKVLLVAFCLNFIKLFDLPGLENVEYKEFLFIVLLAEFIFVIAGLYKFINFYWLQTDYTLEDLQTYYPISLINLRDYISTHY